MTRYSSGERCRSLTVDQVEAASAPPSARGTEQQPHEPVVTAVGHVAGESGPDQADDGAGAVLGVDAGAADLDQVVADRAEAPEVELAVGVEASGGPGAVGRQQAVGADDLAGGLLAYEEVVAVRVEGVAVQAGLGSVEAGAQLFGEDEVAQALRGPYVVLVAGEGDDVAGGGGGVGGGDPRRGRGEGPDGSPGDGLGGGLRGALGGEVRGARGGEGERERGGDDGGHGSLLCR